MSVCGCNLNSQNNSVTTKQASWPQFSKSQRLTAVSRQPNLPRTLRCWYWSPKGLLACWLQPAERADPDIGPPSQSLRGLHHCCLTDVTEVGPPAQWGPAVPWTCSPEPLPPLQTPLCLPSLSGFSWLNGRCSFPKVMPSELGPTKAT